jgi:hypothetical protein
MTLGKQVAIFLILLLTNSALAFAEAQLVKAELPYRAEPISQWIEVVEQGRDRSIIAQVSKTPKKLIVSTYVDDAEPHALISGVALLANGEIISSPLRELSSAFGQGEGESLQVAKQTVDTLEAQIKVERIEVSKLEAEQEAKTRELRMAAGLGEVDAQLQKAAALATKIGAMRDAIRELTQEVELFAGDVAVP